ncbi:MAG: hypothetical protein ACYS8X_09990 [Planctomycetota bacterium]|jgi:hypothetical protein
MATKTPLAFRRYGRSLHPVIKTAADLAAAVELDEAHWVATAAPIHTLNADLALLKYLDADANGRIMCWEMRHAAGWLLEVLADHGGVNRGESALALESLNTDTPDGQAIATAARKMLTRMGKADTDALTLEQVRQIESEVAGSSVSEAGVVLPEAATDGEIAQFITDIIAAVGGAPHPSGQPGVGEAQLDAFLTDAAAFLDWQQTGQVPPAGQTNDVFPLGDKTADAYAAMAAVRDKLEQYFAQCRAVSLDASLIDRMGWTPGELDTLDLDDTAAIDEMLTAAPIAQAKPTGELSFADPINPRDAGALEQFRHKVVEAVVGESAALSARQWEQVKAFFSAHEAWLGAKPASDVGSLGTDTLTQYLDARYAAAVRELIARSKQTAFDLDNIRLAERLLLYQANMLDVANNFLAFPALYDPERRAMFETGTFVADGQRFTLAVKVENRAQHATMASGSSMFLMYVAVTPRTGTPAYEVAVPVTAGNKGNLCVGKRGIFQDRDSMQHDAQVVQIVENPISLTEAMVAPFVRLGKLLTGKIESITAQAEKKLDTQAAAAMSQVGTPQPPQPQAGRSAMASGGMMMGAGVAVAALGSAVAYMTRTLAETEWWQILVVIGAAVLAVLLPTIIIASMKLRKRDLSSMLEGAGWAINARMRLTRKQGRVFTNKPRLPLGSTLIGGRRARRIVIAVIVVVILALAGWFIADRYIFGLAKEEPTPEVEKDVGDRDEAIDSGEPKDDEAKDLPSEDETAPPPGAPAAP